jgi:hypothetical protein
LQVCYLSCEAAHCRGGYYFCLDTKETKNQVIRNASLPHKAIAPQIRQNLGCYIFTPLSLRAWLLCFCKNLLCPAITHKTTIVLPAFIRSCSTDGEEASPKPSPKARALNELIDP